MKKYKVWAVETVTHLIDVEAESREEAESLASDKFNNKTIIDGEYLEVIRIEERV